MDLNSIEREKRDNLKNLQEKRDFRISLLIRSNVSNDVTSKIIYLLKILFIYCTGFHWKKLCDSANSKNSGCAFILQSSKIHSFVTFNPVFDICFLNLISCVRVYEPF